MSYMLLIVEQRGQRGVAAGHVAYDRMLRFSERLQARGVLQASESLASQAQGARVQLRDGRRVVPTARSPRPRR